MAKRTDTMSKTLCCLVFVCDRCKVELSDTPSQLRCAVVRRKGDVAILPIVRQAEPIATRAS